MTKQQIKILRYIRKQPRTWEDVCNKFNIPCDTTSKLYLDAFGDNFLDYADGTRKEPHFKSIIEINNKGIAFLEERDKDTFHRWMPYAYSTIALIVSIIALIKAW